MNTQQAKEAREAGVRVTSTRWIQKIEQDWIKRLAAGWDHLFVSGLEMEPPEVQAIVAEHFQKLNYEFSLGRWYSAWSEHEEYCLRIESKVEEPGLFRQILTRIFGGSSA